MNHDRRSKIVEMLNGNSTITNAEIMERFGISIETVRRDLAYLEKIGALERVYGGAIKKNFIKEEPEYIKREQNNEKIKTALATAAEQFAEAKDSVFFDVGTTVLQIANRITQSKNIKAVTNSLRAAIALSKNGCDAFMLGGQLRNGELSTSGIVAQNNASLFNIDKAFIGVGGIDETGITDFIQDEAFLRSQIIKNAGTVIAVADNSKFGIKAMYKVCAPKEIDILITDNKAPKMILNYYKKQGVTVIIV